MVTIHLAILVATILVIITADSQGMLWMRGKKELLDARRIKLLHKLMWTGLSGMIITGAIMAWPIREFLLQNTAFYVKMGFVLMIVINGFAIGKLSPIATTRTFASLTKREQLPLLVSGVVSFTGWAGAIIAAYSMGI